MKILEKIKEWRLACKKESFRKRMARNNPTPTEYKLWEHNKWGDSIQFMDTSHSPYRIVGWLMNSPKNGDKLIYDAESGKRVVGYIVNVEYCGDPKDMFFADVVPFEYVKAN